LFELTAVIECKHVQVAAQRAAHGRRVMHVLEPVIQVGTGNRRRTRQKLFELDAARHCGRAAMPAHDERTARIAESRAFRQRPAAEPAVQQTAEERVAGAEHVQDFDGKARYVETRCERLRRRAFAPIFDNCAAGRSALDNDGSRCELANGAHGSQHVVRAPGNENFLFGADDQIAERQHALQRRGHLGRLDEARGSIAGGSQLPQHRPVVDVENRARIVGAGPAECLLDRSARLCGRQMGASDSERATRRNVAFVEVCDFEAHVGALLAKEDMRVRAFPFDAEHDQASEPLRIGGNVADVDPLACERLAHETSHVLVADARQHGGAQTEPCSAGRQVCGRAAEILREALHVLETPAELLAVQVDRSASETNEIERAGAHFFDPSKSGGRQKSASGCIVQECSAVNSGTVYGLSGRWRITQE
jgi:hypothetical protein